ncbi:hypothetical protein CASFOL_026201 [Castilleja foliolosa]|uniref:DUF7086 domain-containing protein n=1 Tax=Castilleja foliolosa TaxID=1961234 RepID=A0ABD3CKT3_9LAMI
MDNNENDENNRKRKMNRRQDSLSPKNPAKYTATTTDDENDADLLTLDLFTFSTTTEHPPKPSRRKATKDKIYEPIPPPFPWSTENRAVVHSLEYLLSNEITTISGEVHCKRCERSYTIDLDLKPRFEEIKAFVEANKHIMLQRAPTSWLSPSVPKCKFCDQENCVKPVVALKKRSINWLFLFLAQMLGFCTLNQLKYFCKHTDNHRTGAKNRVLYLTYFGICKQLQPIPLFNY